MSDQWSGRPPGDAALVSGPHWVRLYGADEPEVLLWFAKSERWTTLGGEHPAIIMGSEAEYISPCRTPAQHAAEIAEAEARGMERAAVMVDCGCPNKAAAVSARMSTARWAACGHDPCGGRDADAIRAAASARRATTEDSRDV